MYTIKEQTFFLDNGLEEMLNQIRKYLHNNQIVISDKNGIPLGEEEIINIISTNSTYKFNTISISAIENDIVNEMIAYVDKVEGYLAYLSNSNDNEFIINTFIDLINSLVEIAKVAQYNKIDFVTNEHINQMAKNAIIRIEKGDIDYIIDMIEYEISPVLLDFKSKLLERQYH